MNTLSDCIVTGTTDASGDLTLTSKIGPVGGLLYAIEWIDGDFADGVDAVFSCIGTGSGVDQLLLTLTDANADKWYYPRVATHDNVGTANGGADYAVINGKVKLVVSDGGNAKTGGCIVWYWRP